MTVLDSPRLDDPTERPVRSGPTVAAPRRAVSSWRLVARLARRETRRRPGRTLLVALLVVVPVVGMTLGSIIARSTAVDETSLFGAEAGRADLVVLHADHQSAELAERIGDDGRIVTVLRTDTQLIGRAGDGQPRSRYVRLTDVPMADPILEGAFELDAGRAPETADEVFLSRNLASAFGVSVGDRLALDQPDATWIVTGIGRSTANLSDTFAVLGELDPSAIVEERRSFLSLVDLDDSVTADDERKLVDELAATQLFADSRRFASPYVGGSASAEARELAWGWVAGVVALIAVGIVIAAAFATSARRQLQTVGQLAANGASERAVRRSLGLQGSWTGLLGSIVGVGVGVAIAVAGWPVVEELFNRRIRDIVIAPTDLVVIVVTATVAATVAALVPARTAARVPVLAALAGRRPLSEPPRWMGPVGVASFVGGLLLLVVAANSTSTSTGGDAVALVAVVGGLGVLLGIVCSSPLVVHWVGALGARAPGIARLAVRSLARSRTRSAAVITAIATVMAIATAGLTAVGAERSPARSSGSPLDRVTLTFIDDAVGDTTIVAAGGATVDRAAGRPDPLPADLRSGLEAILPEARWIEVRTVVFDPAPATGGEVDHGIERVAVATPDVLALLDLDDAQTAALAETGSVVLVPGWDVVIRAETADGVRVFDLGTGPAVDVRPEDWQPGTLPVSAVVTTEWLATSGLEASTTTWVLDNPTELSDRERSALGVVSSGFLPWAGDSAFVSDQPQVDDDVPSAGGSPFRFWTVNWYSPDATPPWVLINAVVLAAALVIVLLVVAVGLALSATEGRNERDVLHAVGAPPSALRRLAAAQAWVVTTAAAVIAVPAGYVVMLVISRSLDRAAPFPSVAGSALLVGIPLVAAASCWVVSGVAQRFRPVDASSLAAD